MLKILVAEDEPELLQIYKIVLANSGFDVVPTINGQICVDAYRAELSKRTDKSHDPFDLVLLDLRMPKKTGTEAAREILELSPSQKILMVTAWGGQINLTNEQLKKITVLEKPVDIDDLIDRIKELAEQRI
jgi:DNA-binding response OmpR family regulator